MAEEGSFVRAILTNPADDLPRMVYADWLDEQQTEVATDKADFLRLVVALRNGQQRKGDRVRVRQLAGRLPSGWLVAVSHAAVENCAVAGTATHGRKLRQSLETVSFAFECPKQWAAMTPTDDDKVRHCEACKKNVYYCDTLHQARHHAWAGDCVAVTLAVPRVKGDLNPIPRMLAGIVAPPAAWDEGETLREEDA